MYHKREVGQSKEIFRLKGGTHVRRDKKGHVLVRIRFDDTCHITKREAEKFGDRFEVVELPITADDITIPDGEEISEDEAQLKKAVESSTSDAPIDIGSLEGMGKITPSEPNPPPTPPASAALSREDFSSDAAFDKWEGSGHPDLSSIPKSGHNGTTYSVKDVKSAG